MNATSSKQLVFVSGKIQWAKVLGDPVPNYQKDGREWTFEVVLDDASIVKLTKAGIEDRIKGRGYNIGTKGQHKERDPFLQLRKPEFAKNGNKNSPIRVYDEDQVAWDQDIMIGNDSVVDVKLDVRDYGPGKKQGVYPAAIRITELVEYEGSAEFDAMDGDDTPAKPKAAKAKKAADQVAKDFGTELNDEVPF